MPEPKYYKVSKISEIFGIPAKMVRDMCYARGQKFAFKPGGEKGNWLIDKERFEKYIERRMQA